MTDRHTPMKLSNSHTLEYICLALAPTIEFKCVWQDLQTIKPVWLFR